MLDAEIRKRILGYTQWFNPISKEQLHELLENRHYTSEQISSNSERLIDEDLLLETENLYMNNKHESRNY